MSGFKDTSLGEIIPPEMSQEERALLRNRIVISWILLTVSYGFGASFLVLGFKSLVPLGVAVAALMLGRLLRSLKRPAPSDWSKRSSLYMGSYVLPLCAVFMADSLDIPGVAKWCLVALSVVPFCKIQLSDDQQILRAIKFRDSAEQAANQVSEPTAASGRGSP